MPVPDPANNATFRRILVGTDCSVPARNATDWAIALARAHGAELVIVHVREATDRAPADQGGEHAASVLAELEAAARSAGVAVSTEVRSGRAWSALTEYVRETSAELIVVGSHGHTTMLPLLLGSTTDRLVRVTETPVLAVHPCDARHEPGISQVLVATDFSEEASQALCSATQLLRGFPGTGRLILLHVEGTPLFYESSPASAVAQDLQDITREAMTGLESWAEPLREMGFDVVTIVRDGYAPVVISDEAKAHDVDVIAMGARGRSALASFFVGSVAERVLHHAAHPVLLTRRQPGT